MIDKILVHFDDPSSPLLGPSLWSAKTIGMYLPDHKYKRMGHVTMFLLLVYYQLTQYVDLYFIRSDLNLVLTNLKGSMLSSMTVYKIITILIWQKRWKQIIKYVIKDDNEERIDQNETKRKIIDSYTKYCRHVTFYYHILVFTTFLSVVTMPLMKYISSSTYREELRNGTEPYPQIFSSWMPFDKFTLPGYWFTLLWHTGVCACGAFSTGTYDCLVITITGYFACKMELLREKSTRMLGTEGAPISDYQAIKNVRELHGIHVQFTEHFRRFNSLVSPVMFIYVVMCSLMLCASAYQYSVRYIIYHFTLFLAIHCWTVYFDHKQMIMPYGIWSYETTKEGVIAPDSAEKSLLIEYILFGFIQLLLYCLHSNEVLVRSQALSSGPYESAWTTANVKQRKAVLMLSGQFFITHKCTAGPFTDMTLSTFITILKGAYSYYTLLK